MTPQVSRRHLLAGMAVTATATVVGGGTASAETSVGQRLTTGVEKLIASGYAAVSGQKVGLISNPTGVLRDLRHEVDVMAPDDRIDLVAVFGPEHGFRGSSQAGGSEGSYQDPRTGLPVYDMYAKSTDAIAAQFDKAGLDTVMFDIQDAGARFYTYIWTMYQGMEAAVKTGKRFVVLDRPNPIGGVNAYGPVLKPGFTSGVGREPIAQSHGMTVGELAQLFNDQYLPGEVGGKVDLDVVTMDGWYRDEPYANTGLPWVLPSPNMPTVDTATVYPGTCMFEGTTLSEGRGTTRPFEIIGAPYVDYHWSDALNDMKLPGVRFRETYFAPTFSKWVNQMCGGVELYVSDRGSFDAIRTATAMLVTLKSLYPNDFAWRSDNYIDLLTGSDYVRKAIDAGQDTDQVVAGWQQDLAAFRQLRERYLIYRRVNGA
jgi:uncharacterized protein YbbC (DUF1343 family)